MCKEKDNPRSSINEGRHSDWLTRSQIIEKIKKLEKDFRNHKHIRDYSKELSELKELIHGYSRRHPDGDVEEDIGLIKENEIQHDRIDYEIKELKEQIQQLDKKILLIYQGKTPTEADIILDKLGGEKSGEVLRQHPVVDQQIKAGERFDSVADSKPSSNMIRNITYQDGETTTNTNPLAETANIKQIIEIYDNGHENVFYPNTHNIISNEKLNFLISWADFGITVQDISDHPGILEKLKNIKKEFNWKRE